MPGDGLNALLYVAAVFLLSISSFQAHSREDPCKFQGSSSAESTVYQLQIVEYPRSVEAFDAQEVEVTCVVRCLYQDCNPVISFFRQDKDTEVWHSVPGEFWKGIHYQWNCYDCSGAVSCSLIVKSFDRVYEGSYSCVFWESRDKNNNQTLPFKIEYPPNEQGDAHSLLNCVLPEVSNIRAIPSFPENESSGAVQLTWDVSVKEDDNLELCTGGKNWKVRVSVYNGGTDIPNDFEPSDNAIYSDWENVQDENTYHTLNFTFTNTLYYLFEVSHRSDTLENGASVFAKKFPSHVFYFGSQVDARIEESYADGTTTLTVGQSTEVKCVATGKPPPSVIFNRGEFHPNGSVATLSLTQVKEKDSGIYVCYASNVIVNPPSGRRFSSHAIGYRVEVEAKEPAIEGIGCQYPEDYRGFCSDYIQPELLFFTNYSTAGARESTVGQLMTKIDTLTEDKRCRDLAYAMVCNTLYAPCSTFPDMFSPRLICHSACEVFSTSGDCSGLIGPEDEDVYPYISQCDTPGKKRGNVSECVPLSLEAPRIDEYDTIEDTGSCVRSDGRGFSGKYTMTRSNRTCQSWESTFPHNHPMRPNIFRTDLRKPNSEESCRNPGGVGDQPWCYTTDPDLRWDYCDIPKCDLCEDYRGSVCLSLPGYSTKQVLIRKGKSLSGQEKLEEDIVHLINSLKVHHVLTTGCKDFLLTALCHATFPFCQEGSEDEPLKLCGDHCQLLENLEMFCPGVYREYQQYVTDHTAMVSNAECDLVTGLDSECIPLPPPPDSSSNPSHNFTENCYTAQGRDYRGTASHTKSNILCSRWDSNEPRMDFITVQNYPELEGAENYCRNPGGILTDPWCYASSGVDKWDYCDIPICQLEQGVAIPDGSVPENAEEVPFGGSSATTIILSVFLVIVTIIVIGVALLAIIVYYKKHRPKKSQQQMPYRISNIISEEKYCSNPDYTTHATDILSTPGAVVIPDSFQHIDKEKITYVSQLGQGNFGVVFKGKAVGIVEGTNEVEVAVKTLKEEAAVEMVSSFVDEAKLMFSFDHPNILTIYGVCMADFPYQMVFEYMDEGDLTQFLRSRASSTQRRLLFPFTYRSRTESSFSNDPPSLSKTQLLHISEQIACGMAYLAAKNHVHRDLACRNCLIKKDLTVKIGDFGMSRNLYSRDYYRINGQAILPVRWMSPEALIYGKFSIEGDVWSFGVVMWEVFAFALQPYYGISNEEVTEYIRKGRTLCRPDYCPMEVFKVMQECWNMEPNERPTFDELHKMLNELHERASMSDDGKDETMSIDSDLPSDAFYSDGMSIDDDLA